MDKNLLARVASYYYNDELTQSEIAERLGLSRVKVYRLLKEARAEGVVQITITWPTSRDTVLEERLRSVFGLQDALVLAVQPAEAAPIRRIGQLGARYLEGILEDGMTMTVCLGRSTYEVIDAIRPGFRARVHVAQAMGTMAFALHEIDSATLARQLAIKLGGEVSYLSSPILADSEQSAQVLRSQRDIQRTLQAARAAQVALVGIGNLDPATSGFVKAGLITPAELAQLAEQGAIGDIAGQIITRNGELHPCSHNQRLIGITLDELRAIPQTIAVAIGREKSAAIAAALRTQAVNVLVTDAMTAELVVQQYSQ
jgi:deoxyribonucleoside regulator